MIIPEKKQAAIADIAKDKKDTGSSSVQVAILTSRIQEITDHLKKNKKDFAARRGLLQLVGKRKRHLKYIAKNDSKEYLALIKKLGIRR